MRKRTKKGGRRGDRKRKGRQGVWRRSESVGVSPGIPASPWARGGTIPMLVRECGMKDGPKREGLQ